MKSPMRLLLAFSVITLALAFSASAAPDYGAYHDALGQLRTARAYIEHPDSGVLHDQEKNAMAEIDAAINELLSVANDGKGPDDHAPLDSHKRWIARLNEAAKLLNKAHDNVQRENDGSGAKDRAIQHIGQASKYIQQAIALEQ
ncbi:MAG TPA: hypothetical protein VEJ38_07715 [Candidatus Acidoferrales bacterium]|nr:hypothetical protein [Candidatus Acidoferrales bacterium]